jgi:methylglutamate dehydrogenase subunit C
VSQPHRLASSGLIERDAPLSFRFDGKTITGFRGDTLASALLANGVKLIGRSFKYHRPRGLLSAGPEEPNGLVELNSGARRTPNSKATTVELHDGLEATSQNRWPSLRFDIASLNSLFAPLLGAGFYYKTFMWPASFWEGLYEPAIRRAAGLGRVATDADPDRYEKAFAHCDVLVIGSGPAGLMAALTAGRSGARVILAEEDFRLGGRLLSERHEIDGRPAALWASETAAELASLPDVTILRRTAVFGVYDDRTYGALERVTDHRANATPGVPRQRLWKIIARHTVLASGAIERPLVFGGNDRPGVMLAASLRTYLNRFAAAPGSRFAVYTAGDDGWRTAADLIACGCEVTAVIDPRTEIAAALSDPIASAGIRVMLGARVVGTRGGHALKAIDVRDERGSTARIEADALAMSNGWDPLIGLTSHLGARPQWSDAIQAFVPGKPLPSGMTVVGAAVGHFTLTQAFADGARAGSAAAANAGFPTSSQRVPITDDEPAGLRPFWHVADLRGKAFVDYQHDVTVNDIVLANQEGFRSAEHLKRYTTLGMATDQGRTSNVNGLAIMAVLSGRPVGNMGSASARPPYAPVAIAAFAGPHRGKHFRPTRLTSGHGWAQQQGAQFVDAGQWRRAQWFPQPGDADWLATVCREAQAVRNAVGICDVSTLGKIDVQGQDAGGFLDRVYINAFSTLAVGRARYGVMLREDGFVLDDGTVARFAPDHFVLSTTTANAARVMQHLEFCHQVLWPQLDVQLVSVTEQWAQYAVAGPHSRRVIENLTGSSFDVSNAAFPHMACAELEIGNITARLFRLSFSGELAYEIAAPARYGDALIRALMQAGEEFGARPYGTEALGVLRVEKGHIGGQELSGQTTARDLGLGRMMSTEKDYVGRVMAQRPGLSAADRPTLVGFVPVNAGQRLRAGAHLLPLDAARTVENDQGYLTSVVYSPAVGHWIGLGLLQQGPSRIGQRVRAYDPVRNGDVEVAIVSSAFVDPEGKRLRG